MLLTFKQMKHLQPDGEDTYYFEGKGVAIKEGIQELIEFDESYVDLYGKHMITNYEDLK